MQRIINYSQFKNNLLLNTNSSSVLSKNIFLLRNRDYSTIYRKQDGTTVRSPFPNQPHSDPKPTIPPKEISPYPPKDPNPNPTPFPNNPKKPKPTDFPIEDELYPQPI
ncbi:hypothetical protein CYY_004481 [Polysphondylium violaceum]|uniref:Uncharacterized protein n=1 Tax=Polysphondylium violaceum TaxID=133409 RepID=A0A8J4PW47_9MYCE|nr:hypothetical protein CYY_004481 [Polysphondylium violaceum]